MANVTYTFTAGTKAQSAQVNKNFDDCITGINKNESDIEDIKADILNIGASITSINSSISNLSAKAFSVGDIKWCAYDTVPNGFLVCDGSAVSRSTYSLLFQVIGTTFGAGDSSTTFNLPNLIDKFIEGSTTVGTVKSAGIPNLKGDCYVTGNVGPTSATGPFYFDGSWAGEVPDDHRFGVPYIKFDASRVSTVYSNSVTTVQPPALTLLPCIKY